MKGTFAILGLGTFGSKLAVELSNAGHSVVAIDHNKSRVEEIKDKVSAAIIADVSNPDTIRELEVRKFDAVIIGMSSHFEDLILALTLVKQEGAKKVIAKSNTSIQKRILQRLGADEVIQPDQDIAERLSKRLSMSNISDMFEFKGSSIAEVTVPEALAGKSIRELDLRRRYSIIVLLIKKPGRDIETVWDPNLTLERGDELTVIGEEKKILNLFKS
ncbi:TrkA family potassium uptake protein [Lentisphaerota bacterium ZTH]|nr:TrkA family potassium uptake protein [Lentisphaerota bacterium]WET06458.1 TrkA family potassium uptake protein [Lentisphaerota bacterium ZTH]